MRLSLFCLGILLLAACGSQDKPLPTLLNEETARATAGILPTQNFETQTAVAMNASPTQPIIATWTFTPSNTPTATLTPTPTLSPTFTETLSPIQETEIFLYQRETNIAATATAMVITPSPTPSELTSTFTPIVLPGSTWGNITTPYTTEQLATVLQERLSLSNAHITLTGIFLEIRWSEGDTQHALVTRQDALNGELIVTPIRYRINGNPVDFRQAQAQSFFIREAILNASIPVGDYSLIDIQYDAVGITFLFKLPLE